MSILQVGTHLRGVPNIQVLSNAVLEKDTTSETENENGDGSESHPYLFSSARSCNRLRFA